jgi:glycosyltransferase involved in cell wall biosynthesis
MKLLMLGWELPPHNSGGLGVACYQMAKALHKRGVEIDFVLPGDGDYSAIDFMKVHKINAKTEPKAKCIIRKNLSSFDPYTNDTNTVQKIHQQYISYIEDLLSKNNYDAIHAHDWLTMQAGVRAKEISGKPLIVQVHATEFDRAGGGLGNPLIHEIEEQGLMMADRIIAVSKLTKNLIVKNYNIPPDKIEVIHNAVSRDELEKHPITNDNYRYLQFMRSQGYMIVANVGRLTIQKGLPFLLEAAQKALAMYPKMIFVLAGDGEQRNELFELAASYGIVDKVVFTGFVRGSQWREIFAEADVFVMSSVSEPFGLTALEAAAHGNALIVTKQSGVAERLRNILLYDFWDTNRLADELINLAISPALLETLQNEAANEFNKYSWEEAAELFEREYARAVHGGIYA